MTFRPLSLKSLVAAALVATAFATSAAVSPVSAADLGYGHGSMKDGPYDDPRYSDIYRHPAPPPPPPVYSAPSYHPPRYAAPYPPAPVYRDEPRYAPPPAYAGPPPRHYGEQRPAGCVPRDVARARLEQRGWHDFHDPQVSGEVAHIRARRPNGRIFDLTIDRCSGEVLAAEVADGRRAEAPQPDWRYRDNRDYRDYRY